MDISRLRTSTAADHQSVEGVMPLMDPALTIDTYINVLERLRSIVFAWELLLKLQEHKAVSLLASERCRLALIEHDLNAFGKNQPTLALVELPAFENQAQLLGAMYVMEGSRLGGLLIAKHVESHFGFERGQGTSYFRGFGERTGPMWKQFLDILNTTIPDESTDEVISGVKKMFAAFGALMAA